MIDRIPNDLSLEFSAAVSFPKEHLDSIMGKRDLLRKKNRQEMPSINLRPSQGGY